MSRAIAARSELLGRGYAVVPALSGSEIDRIKWGIDMRAAKDTDGETTATNPVTPLNGMHRFLIQRGVDILNAMGFGGIRYAGGAIIPKVPGEPRRPWHTDWWAWDRSEAWQVNPPQVGVIFYLDPATYETGNLIVMPGSHRRFMRGVVSLYDQKLACPDEVEVPCGAGQAVVIDSRLMHAVGQNRTTHETRIAVTMWYMLGWDGLSLAIKKTASQTMGPPEWEAMPGLMPICREESPMISHSKIPRFPITLARIEQFKALCGSDLEAINGDVDPEDSALPVITGYETYPWYRAIGMAKAPETIAEFGVRRGYSGLAMCLGANTMGVRPIYRGWDMEQDIPGSNDVAMQRIKRTAAVQTVMTTKANTRHVRKSDEKWADLVHVDADHTIDGINHELQLALSLVNPDGLIVVDDCVAPHIAKAVVEMADTIGKPITWLPSMTKIAIIDLT